MGPAVDRTFLSLQQIILQESLQIALTAAILSLELILTAIHGLHSFRQVYRHLGNEMAHGAGAAAGRHALLQRARPVTAAPQLPDRRVSTARSSGGKGSGSRGPAAQGWL